MALILIVLAGLLAESQARDREDARKRFNDVAEVSAAVTNGIFQSSLGAVTQQAAERLGGPRPTDAQVTALAARGQLVYAAVLDSRGEVLAATRSAPDDFGAAVDTARETGKPRLSDSMELGSKRVVEWAIPFQGAAGNRIYVQGIPAQTFSAFLKGTLADLPNFADAETVMIDSAGVVLGGVRSSTRVGEQMDDSELLEAVNRDQHGSYGDGRYFARGGIEGSPFYIVLNTDESDLYDSIPGSRKTLPWIIFAAFALVSIAGLAVLRRALNAAAELERRELNERHAVEINDNIIQGLALAKYQLQHGLGEASAAQLSDTLREAQRLVSGLLGDAEIQAGQLRREEAAETRGPEDSGEEPKA